MISFQDLMKGFGVVTVMNACIYKLAPGLSYTGKSRCAHSKTYRALTPFDFECTHLYIDTLKIANLTQEGPTKTVTGGQYANPLLKYGKTMTLEMQNALGSAEILKTFFGCDYDEVNGILSVTDKFPSPFAIEGETFFIDQKTGQKKKVWIFIPYFLPDGIFNLTQDAEGDAAVFDCNGSVGMVKIKDDTHPEGHDIFYHIAERSWLRFGYTINNNLSYVLNSNGNTYSIAGLTVNNYTGDLIIPAIHNGMRVTTIASDAFNTTNKPNISINNVYIPSSITHIYSYAFAGQQNLSKIVFGGQSNLRWIDEGAFEGTESLKNITIPEKVWWVDSTAFGSYSWDGTNKTATLSNPSGVINEIYDIDPGSGDDGTDAGYWWMCVDTWALASEKIGDPFGGPDFYIVIPSTIKNLATIVFNSDLYSPSIDIINSQAEHEEDSYPMGATDINAVFIEGANKTEIVLSVHIENNIWFGAPSSGYDYYGGVIAFSIPKNITCYNKNTCSLGQGTYSYNYDITIPPTVFSFKYNALEGAHDLIMRLPWTQEEANLRGYPWGADLDNNITFYFKQ